MTSIPGPDQHASETGQAAGLAGADTPAAGAVDGTASPAASGSAPGNVCDALRSIYQNTVQEDVPDEMIDLLSRLD